MSGDWRVAPSQSPVTFPLTSHHSPSASQVTSHGRDKLSPGIVFGLSRGAARRTADRSPRLNPHLESTLFYTMSTISQTLSGAMGLLGAIVLFALQETSRSVERAARALADIPHDSESALYLRHLLARRSFHEFAQRYSRLLAERGSTDIASDLLVHHSTLTWELEHDTALRRSFWSALRATGVVIAFALICCGTATQLSDRSPLGQIALAAGTLMAVACLALYGTLLRVMLRSTPEDPAK